MMSRWPVVLFFSVSLSLANDLGEITVALQSGNYSKALDLTESELKNSPHSAKLLTLVGIAEEGLGDAQKALQSYTRALAESPEYLPALKGKASIEYRTGNAEASGTLGAILKLQPKDAVANAMLGAISYRSHDCARARSHFEAGFSVIRSEPVALTQYAYCLLEEHQNEKAANILKQAAALKPNDWTGVYNVALAQVLTKHSGAPYAGQWVALHERQLITYGLSSSQLVRLRARRESRNHFSPVFRTKIYRLATGTMHQLQFTGFHSYASDEEGGSVPIGLRAGNAVVRLAATVNTGAFCIFRSELAEALDLDLRNGLHQRFRMTNSSFEAFGHEVDLTVLDVITRSTVYFFADETINKNVLGRIGWLDRI